MTSRNTQDLSPWTMTNLTIFCWVFSFLGFKKKDIRDKTFWVSSSRITPEVVDQSATKAPKIDVFTKHSPFSKGSFHVFFGYLKVAFLRGTSGFWGVGEKTTSWSNLYLIPPHCVKILIPPTPNNPWCVHRFASCAHPSEGILRSEFLTMAMKGCFVWIFWEKKSACKHSIMANTVSQQKPWGNCNFNPIIRCSTESSYKYIIQDNSSSNYTYFW